MPLIDLLYRWLLTWLAPGSDDALRAPLPALQPVRVQHPAPASTPATRRAAVWAQRSQPPRSAPWRP